ncbi:DotU family type IV/VI secretion system protein [Vibrio cholerae]|nr:DotU family type IV/VI secretion system protein [Vibrio cholerae]
MNGLFNEEPTLVLSRADGKQQAANSSGAFKRADLIGSDKLIDNFDVYSSPLLNAATELLGTLVTLPRQGAPRDIDLFRQRLLDAIGTFKQRGIYLEYHPSVVEKSCFVICAAFDEAILYTPWGKAARWENHSLLSKVFLQRNGGEVFFQLLDNARQQPSKLIDFIELQYLLLMLGFQGRYRFSDENLLQEVKSDIYSIICHYRKDVTLPVPQTPELIQGKQPLHILKTGKILTLILFAVLGSYGMSEYWYYNRSQSILETFSSIEPLDSTFKNIKQDLIYLSTDSDLGIIEPVVVQDTINPIAVEVNKLTWEILLAVFSTSSDATRLVSELEPAGYEIALRETENGIEVLLKAGDHLPTIRKLKNELNVRFGLNATIRRAKNK